MISKPIWPLQRKGDRDRTHLTAVVKGSGPAALAAAVTLAQQGFQVKVAGKRPPNTQGGRRNVVVLRPEAMRQLDVLGALPFLEQVGKIQKNQDFRVVNEWTGMDLRPPQVDFRAADYQPPRDRKDHFTTHMVCLGDLEDALERAAHDLGVDVQNEASVLLKATPGTQRLHATLVPNAASHDAIDLGFPDLVVGASGKNDEDLVRQLGVERRTGVKVDVANLPVPGTRAWRLGPDGELETQKFVVLGLANPALANGTFHMRVRKVGEGATQQPINEFKFGHLGVTTLLMQLPRELDTQAPALLEAYVLARTNHHLGAQHASMAQVARAHALVWGDPRRAFDVETKTASTFVYGSNGVLAGDVAAACSPSSGIGAEIAATVDSMNIRQLAADIKERCLAKAAGNPDVGKPRRVALTEYNARKAASVELWSRSSRPFYLSRRASQAVIEASKATRAGV